MSERNTYVGLDVSLAETAIAVVDDRGAILWRGRAASAPAAIAATLARRAPGAVRIGLESGQLSGWLTQGLAGLGLPAICIDAPATPRRPCRCGSTRPMPTTPKAWRRSCASVGSARSRSRPAMPRLHGLCWLLVPNWSGRSPR